MKKKILVNTLLPLAIAPRQHTINVWGDTARNSVTEGITVLCFYRENENTYAEIDNEDNLFCFVQAGSVRFFLCEQKGA
jgi:hypothetical protein